MARGTKAEVSADLAELWSEFKKTASPEARERLILHYAPLVKYVAGRVATGLPATVEQADLSDSKFVAATDAADKALGVKIGGHHEGEVARHGLESRGHIRRARPVDRARRRN